MRKNLKINYENFIFALAFVLAGHLGIANTSNTALDSFEDFGTCTITINFFDDDGDLIGSTSWTTFASSELDCRIQAVEIDLLFD